MEIKINSIDIKESELEAVVSIKTCLDKIKKGFEGDYSRGREEFNVVIYNEIKNAVYKAVLPDIEKHVRDNLDFNDIVRTVNFKIVKNLVTNQEN